MTVVVVMVLVAAGLQARVQAERGPPDLGTAETARRPALVHVGLQIVAAAAVLLVILHQH